MTTSSEILHALHEGVEAGVFPGAVLHVRVGGTTVFHEAVGHTALAPSPCRCHRHTIYDLASLTKPLATGTALLCLVQDGSIRLDQSVSTGVPELEGAEIGEATIRDLAAHRSGLPGWRPYYRDFSSQSAEVGVHQALLLEKIRREPLAYMPRSRSVYSDLGYMLLGIFIERVTGRSLAHYCRERVYAELGIDSLGFRLVGHPSSSVPSLPAEAAPTEWDPWRGRLVWNEVHDEHAYVLGGVAGHAGLFGTAEGVAAMGQAWLDGYWGRSPVFGQSLVQEFVARQAHSDWGIGWDIRSSPSSSGSWFSDKAFGHLGFTGTSLWIDPLAELAVVLLTNRVHPTRENQKIKKFRPLIHDLVYREYVKAS